MEKTITKNLQAIVLRGGLEIWVEEEKIANLKKILMMDRGSKFIEVDGEVINTADITGIFTPKTMEELTRRKNGQWQCKWNHWHQRGEICAHGEMAKYK